MEPRADVPMEPRVDAPMEPRADAPMEPPADDPTFVLASRKRMRPADDQAAIVELDDVASPPAAIVELDDVASPPAAIVEPDDVAPPPAHREDWFVPWNFGNSFFNIDACVFNWVASNPWRMMLPGSMLASRLQRTWTRTLWLRLKKNAQNASGLTPENGTQPGYRKAYFSLIYLGCQVWLLCCFWRECQNVFLFHFIFEVAKGGASSDGQTKVQAKAKCKNKSKKAKDEPNADESKADESMKNETVKDESVKGESVKDESVKDESKKDESKDDSIIKEDANSSHRSTLHHARWNFVSRLVWVPVFFACFGFMMFEVYVLERFGSMCIHQIYLRFGSIWRITRATSLLSTKPMLRGWRLTSGPNSWLPAQI